MHWDEPWPKLAAGSLEDRRIAQMDLEAYVGSIARCSPQIRIRAWKPILEGWDSVVVEVNGELIFRFPRRSQVQAQLEKEILLLPELARVLPVSVPRFDFVGTVDDSEDTRFVGYRKIGGEGLTREMPGPWSVRRRERQLAAFLSELHRFPVGEAVRLGVGCCSSAQWRQEYRNFRDRVRREVLPLLQPVVRARANAVWNEFLDSEESFRFAPVLVHRDLGGEHILCDPDQGDVTGIIDWGDASIGDPAIDFAGLLCDFGAEFTRGVLAGYEGEVGETFWSRVEFYARIVGFYEILYGLQEGNSTHVAYGLERLKLDL